ncbi:MAG: response regulator transcription factor [Candidatus Sulfotelmatobacter sp.]|jgi:DNA-binding NarL/FixJ family response regulator
MIRILVVDDNEYVRRGVLNILASNKNLEVCGVAQDGQEAIQKARELAPDLVLLDISMPGMDGLEAARILRSEIPSARILIMSQHDPIQILQRVLDAGVQGCVDKGRLATDLLPCIENIIHSPGMDAGSPG